MPLISPSWSGVQNPNSITCSFGDYISQEMSPGVGSGIFTTTFNTGSFSAGVTSEVYWVEITGSLSAISKFASVVVPIGLRINPKDMTIKEGLGYLPKIVEVNKDFFPVLLEAVNQTAEEIVKIMKNLTKSPGKDSTQ